ncbi:MAG TPA: ATP-binding protein [Bacillota bacterium]|nr:ATP-binding protein [Bacillota bacterium]
MLRILQLEDDPVDAQLALRLLREGGLDVAADRIHTFAAFKQFLEQHSYALILADYTVPGVDVFKVLETARQLRPEVPFVFLSGTLGEDVAIETLKMGATDYVLKQGLNRLVPAVRRALQEAKNQAHRRQAEQDLRESEGRYRALLELAPDAVVVYQEWHFVYVNAAALRLCGAGALEEMWGKEIFEFVPPEEQEAARQRGQCVLQVGTTPLCETRVRRLDGQEVPVEVAGSRVEWLGQPAVQTILRDITERKRIEQELHATREQLLQANAGLERTVQVRTAELREAMEDLRRFSYSIMHDMRAPLRAMHSYATLMQQECSGRERTRHVEFLQRIATAAERLDSLVRDALSYSQVLQQRLPIEPVDVAKLLRGIIESFPNLQPSAAEVSIEEPLPEVLGSKAALTQCFGNLLSNAAKFVAPGTRPRIRIRAEPLTPQAPGLRPCVRFWFEDNGIGIAPEHQAHLFKMFHRLDQSCEGTGIGLAIVRKAIERMGGHVGLESTPGQGSKFWLELPQAGSPLPSRPSPPNTPTKGPLRGASA